MGELLSPQGRVAEINRIEARREKIRRFKASLVDNLNEPIGPVSNSIEGALDALGRGVNNLLVSTAALSIGVGESTAEREIAAAEQIGLTWSPRVRQGLARLERLLLAENRLIERRVQLI